MLNLNSSSSIIRQSTRGPHDPWNILCFSAHERFEQNICGLNANFYALPGQNVRTWNEKYSKIPNNYRFVKQRIPPNIEFDCILSHNPFVHIPLAVPVSRQLHIPIISIFHTDSPNQNWNRQVFEQNKGFFNQAHHHVFITEYNKISWGFIKEPNSTVIEHGIDTELFSPGDQSKGNYVLTVGNDFINRDRELGYSIWKYVTDGLPVKVIGSNPGLSEPAQTQQELVGELRKAKVYLNTTLRSPLAMSLLEAFSVGCPVVTTNTNAIADFFTHGYDCLMFNPSEPEQGRKYVTALLRDDYECKRLGENARKTILEKFKMSTFLGKWNDLLQDVCEKPYLG